MPCLACVLHSICAPTDKVGGIAAAAVGVCAEKSIYRAEDNKEVSLVSLDTLSVYRNNQISQNEVLGKSKFCLYKKTCDQCD
jgi:hypothetical protein